MISEKTTKVLDLFSRGRKLYKLMQFEDAKACFDQALELEPDDGPSRVYQQRCAHYIDTPPPEDWDGVFVMTTK